MREDQGVFAELFNALGILALWGFNSTHCRHALQVIFSERCVKRSENALDTEPGNTAEELCGCFVFGFFFWWSVMRGCCRWHSNQVVISWQSWDEVLTHTHTHTHTYVHKTYRISAIVQWFIEKIYICTTTDKLTLQYGSITAVFRLAPDVHSRWRRVARVTAVDSRRVRPPDFLSDGPSLATHHPPGCHPV